MSQDEIQGFMLEHEDIRGAIVHLNATYQRIIHQRPYPPMVRYLLGEALVSAVLLASSIKFAGRLSVQFEGSAALSLLLVQIDETLGLRAMAKCAPGLTDEAYAGAFLQGQLVINVQSEQQSAGYQSRVPLLSTSMSENLTHFFAQSEQLATRVWLAASDEHAAGMLLQLLPGKGSLEREHFWEYALAMGETVSESELLSLDNTVLLHRLYHETDVRIFDARPVRFQCRCDTGRMQQILTTLGEDELQQMLAEQGKVEVRCGFCNSQHDFDAIDLALLFRQR
ncbi:MAG: Hsp33 family molecular chaperone HslO [Legionellaceae bacterium]|nr:Hsp33 family molecular chaperone HslO [Legionellaceae bacterium]